VKKNKLELKWSKSRFGELSYSYSMNDKEIASIFTKETKDGRIQWGFWIDRIGTHRELNTDNCKLYCGEVKPTYSKRKDVKKTVEEIVGNILNESVNVN
jgi:hypothetical protein